MLEYNIYLLRNRTDMQQVLILKLMVNLLTELKVGQAYQ